MFGGLSLGLLYGLFTKGATKKHDDLVGISLGVLYGLAKIIYARDRPRGAGSEARQKGRERGNLIETTSTPPAAQRAGGIS